jgi:hypothetical protein
VPAHAASVARRPYLWPLFALGVVAAVLVAVLVPNTARAATVELSGVVRNASGTALAGVTVTAINIEDNSTSVTTTSSTGAYAFAALTSAEYTLSFSATSTTFFQYLGGTSDPADYEVIPLDTTTEGNGNVYLPVNLAASGTLAGRVTTVTNAALRNYTVRAYRQNDDGSWSLVMSAKTGSSGAYAMYGLEPGAFHLEAIDLADAHPTYAPVFSGDTTTVDTATTVGILPAKTSTYNFNLGKAGSVSGTVLGEYGASSTESLPGVRVTAYALSGSAPLFDTGTALDSPTTTTAANGTYTLTGLMPGTYTLEFQPPSTAAPAPSGLVYGRTFLGDSDTSTAGQPFTIGNGTTVTGQDITLVDGATISGTVASEGLDEPLPNIEVIADYQYQDPDATSEHAASTLTDANGDFTLTGLGPGIYDVYVGSNASTSPGQSSVGDTSWARQAIQVGPLTSGQVDNTVSVSMVPKIDGGMVATAAPTIAAPDGTAVGDQLGAGNGTWSSTPTSETYQWLSGGHIIAGATDQTYTLRSGDAGNVIAVRVTASNFQYGTGTATSASTGLIGLGTIPTPSPGPSITGTAEVGHVLTALPGEWAVPGVSFTFNWENSVNGTDWNSLGLPSSPTLTFTAADYATGPYVEVIVTANRDGYNSTSATGTLGGTVATAPITMIKAPTVVKTSTNFELVGGTFSPAGTNASDGIEYSFYYEYPNGSGGGGTNQSTNAFPIAGHIGYYITASEERSLLGYTTLSTPNFLVQTGAAPTASGNVAVTGTYQVGQYLYAPNATWSSTAGTVDHQWQYKYGSTWRNITGATGSDYEAAPSDLGRLLRVVTTLVNAGFGTGTLISQAPQVIVAAAAPGFVSGSWSGGTVGTADTLTATPNWSGSPTVFGYQWEYSANSNGPYTKLSGATKASYTIPQSLLNKYLFVEESASSAGSATGTNLLSLGKVVADHLTLVKSATVTHSGTQTIVSPPVFSPAVPSADVSYAWYYTDTNDSNPTLYGPLTTNNVNLSATTEPIAHWYVLTNVDSQTLSNGGTYSYTDTTPLLAQKGSFTPSGAITLPSSQVGAAIIPTSINWTVQNPTLTYQWQYLSGTHWLSIAASGGGTGATFTPSSTYFGRELRVITTASRTNYNSLAVISSTTTPAIGAQLTANSGAGAPTLTGNVDIGQKLTLTPGTWSAAGVTFRYEWDSSPDGGTWTPVAGATSSTFVIPNTAYHALYYRGVIFASKTGYTPGADDLYAAGQPGEGTTVIIKQPGVKYSHGTYTCVDGTWSPAPGNGVDCSWYAINPQTNNRQLLGDSHTFAASLEPAGDLIELVVSTSTTNYAPADSTIVVREGPAIEPTTPITITQNAVEGNTLSLNLVNWTTSSPTVHILWYRNGVATGLDTDSDSYTLGAADVGKTVSAHIIATKPGYVSTTTIVSSTPTFSNVVLGATTDPSITGTPAVDDTLSASPGTWNVTGLTYKYQWYRDGTAIPGATASTYLASATDLGEDITVDVTAAKSFYSPSTADSQPVTVGLGAAITTTAASPIAISGLVAGAVELGHPITATVASKWNMPVSLSYQWQFLNPIFPENIEGANGAIFTAEAGDSSNPPVGSLQVGSFVQLVVTASRPGHTSVTVTSAEYQVEN